VRIRKLIRIRDLCFVFVPDNICICIQIQIKIW